MRASIALLAGLCTVLPAAAQEDDDLARIPGAVASQQAPTEETAPHGKYSVENAFAYSSYRGTLVVPLPYSASSRWSDRTSLDVLDQWRLASDLTFTFSNRLNVTFADGIGFPNEAVRNDPREAYVTWEPLPQTYLEAGRINVRNGVAFGYNPTDYFRARTSVAQASADPGAQRQNRLGTVMFRGQRFFDGGAFEFVYAPKLHKPVPIGVVPDPFDPKIDQTNGADRFLFSFSFELEEFSPQVLVYHESGRTTFGLNLSHPIGNSVIAYASWSGGVAPNAIVDAVTFGERTGTVPHLETFLPPGFPRFVMPTTAARRFQNDLSAGAYWTGEDKVTLSLEYNFHQAGFTGYDWRNWFNIGSDPFYVQNGSASLMWYIRGYAGDQQQPMTRHQAFARVDWVEPFYIEHSDINAFVMSNLHDGSMLGQIAASYDISDVWSVAAFWSGSIGGRRSEWGSMRGDSTAIVQVVRYL